VWEAGALFGGTAKDAFYVLINEELNPAAVRDLGQVVVEIGLAVTRPAEWVVLRIGLWDGGTRITEG
jgi:phage tail sheath protein FI